MLTQAVLLLFILTRVQACGTIVQVRTIVLQVDDHISLVAIILLHRYLHRLALIRRPLSRGLISHSIRRIGSFIVNSY